MATNWRALGNELGRLALRHGPKVIAAVQTAVRSRQASTAIGSPGTPVRPSTTVSEPTSKRARRVLYSPDLDGRADPGEVVWTWVVYEDDPTQGKDRPVLVVGREGVTLLGLMLSSQNHDNDAGWISVGSGPWDAKRRPSWVRTDRVLDVPEDGIRREGAIMPSATFQRIAEVLRSDYGWN